MKNSWQLRLHSLFLKEPEPADRPRRLSLIGIGNELGGDDAAGVAVIQRLQAAYAGRTNLQLVNAGAAPENITGAVRRFQPGMIVLFDAADFGGQPGEVSLLDWRDTTGFSASTHSLPLHVLASYLSGELECPVILVGIQPLSLDFDAPLSPPAAQAVSEIVSTLQDILAVYDSSE